jgi:hypothetical protein
VDVVTNGERNGERRKVEDQDSRINSMLALSENLITMVAAV